jgi:hypothetical protein
MYYVNNVMTNINKNKLWIVINNVMIPLIQKLNMINSCLAITCGKKYNVISKPIKRIILSII